MSLHSVLFLLCLMTVAGAVVVHGVEASGTEHGVLLREDFRNDPLSNGWTQAPPSGQPFEGAWVNDPTKGQSHISVRQGSWESPPLSVNGPGYYRLRFRSRASTNGYWSAAFYDEKGAELTTDVYDAVFASFGWTVKEFFFRTHPLAVKMRIRFRAIDSAPEIAWVELRESDPDAAGRWAERFFSQDPPLHYLPPTDRGALLPRTISTLRSGGALRIVVLGDSIANDISNSLFETVLRCSHPAAHLEVIASVRGGTGCTWYQDQDRIQPYVLQFNPDLLIIAGISHGYNSEAIRNVIRQVRAHSTTEILVLSDTITPDAVMAQGYLKNSGLPEDVAKENIQSFPERLKRMAAEEQVELLDLRGAWNDYIRTSTHSQEWFMRDEIHANSRGKQVVGHMLARYLEPEEHTGR